MEPIKGTEIDLQLSQEYLSGYLNPYKVYYFDIYLSNTSKRIGYIDLRLGHSDYLYYLGNIGYRIDEHWRGHHYALSACKMVLPFAKQRGMEYLIITCDPDNLASKRTLEELGGTFLGRKKIPLHHALYLEGFKAKLIYRYNLKEN